MTARTIAQGDPDTVRGAIDAAWGVVPDARGGRLGALRRALDGERGTPAASITLTVNDGMRARAAGVLAIPAGLRAVAARLDLGNDLDLDGVAVFDDQPRRRPRRATWREAARASWAAADGALLGLRAVFDGLSLTPEGQPASTPAFTSPPTSAKGWRRSCSACCGSSPAAAALTATRE